jgi:hypothetical protein
MTVRTNGISLSLSGRWCVIDVRPRDHWIRKPDAGLIPGETFGATCNFLEFPMKDL